MTFPAAMVLPVVTQTRGFAARDPMGIVNALKDRQAALKDRVHASLLLDANH